MEMFLKLVLVLIISIVVSIESQGGSQASKLRRGRYVAFKGPGRIDRIRKCALGGGQTTDPIFIIGTLESAGLKYDDINHRNTFVNVLGKFETKTIGVSLRKLLDVLLNHYVEVNDFKRFSIYERQEATGSVGNQITALSLNLTLYKTGSIELSTYLYAGTWGFTESCAIAGAEISEVLLRIYDQ